MRELKPDGTVVWRGTTCRWILSAPGPGVKLAVMAGVDDGELTEAVAADLAGVRELFVDAEELGGARPEAAATLVERIARLRGLRRASLLAGADELTVAFARLLGRSGELVQIYSDRQLFAQALAVAAGRRVTLPSQRLARRA